VTTLLDSPPYAARAEREFRAELLALTQHHLDGCPEYRAAWPGWRPTDDVAGFPFLHVGAFKSIRFVTSAAGLRHQRVLKSSATSSGIASQIVLDQRSAELQARSSHAILADFLGSEKRPLVILDSPAGLRSGSEVSARTAGALSLKALASDLVFLLSDAADPASARWEVLLRVLAGHQSLVVYGLTHMLWTAWAAADPPAEVRAALSGKRIDFVHSGGWKKLEHVEVGPEEFDATLMHGLDPRSKVVDFYGLVEQVGVVFPLCSSGYRHVPAWADVFVRDPWTLASQDREPGQLQLLNLLAWGAPYHNVLTEDLGRLSPGECPCGRQGKRFEFLGRMPKAEIRGCANV
jgi:hypothetical protein